MTNYNDTDKVQMKVWVPARVRWSAKSEAARRQLNMGEFIQAAIDEKVAREASQVIGLTPSGEAQGGPDAPAAR